MPSIFILLRKDILLIRNLARSLRHESRFKIIFVLVFATALLGGLFALFVNGFSFLTSLGGAGFMITRHLFALFFLGLSVMLVLSGILTSYSTLFRSREIPFLLVRPIDVRSVVTYQFLESCLLSSWAFLLVILPFVGAYAWHEKLGVLFCLWTLLFSIPLLFLCSGLGSLISLVLVRWFPRGRSVWFALLVTCAGAVYVWLLPGGDPGPSAGPTFIVSRLVPGLRAASQPLVPSWWVAEGIIACARGQPTRGLMLWSVLVSNTLVVFLLVQWAGGLIFYRAYQRVIGSHGAPRRSPVMLRGLERGLRFMPRNVRAMVMKDVRTFLRDPMQWSQALIFFGLLGLYFGSIRSFHYNRCPDEWRNLIAFLNVFAVAAVQCSLAARFIYPQLSLEGRAFWMLGLSPVTHGRILGVKFLVSVISMLAVSISLMVLSTSMLQVEPVVRSVAVGQVTAVSFAVCGLSTGLGAVFLDLRQPNPMAIVSSLGGTMNLVLSLAFMLAAIIPFGLIFHLSFLGHIGRHEMHMGLIGAGTWLAVITLISAGIPLWLGRRSLSARDY